MTTRVAVAYTVLMLLLLAMPLAQAGPWIHPRGESYMRVGVDHFQSAEGTVDGQLTGMAFRSDSLGLYTELGLGRRLQLVGSLPLVSAAQVQSTGTVWRHTWTGDARLELDWGLSEQRPLALGAELRLPTYRDPGEYATAEGIPDDLLSGYALNFPQLGDRSVDATLKLLAGQSLGRGWVQGELGWRQRFGGYASGLHATAAGGWWMVPDRLSVGAFSSLSLKAPWQEPENATRQEWTILAQLSASLPERAPGWAFELRGGGVPWAQASSRGWTAGAGVSWTRRSTE